LAFCLHLETTTQPVIAAIPERVINEGGSHGVPPEPFSNPKQRTPSPSQHTAHSLTTASRDRVKPFMPWPIPNEQSASRDRGFDHRNRIEAACLPPIVDNERCDRRGKM
jgi:hypothetical protein